MDPRACPYPNPVCFFLQTAARICLLQALSPVGRCKALDSTADGYGRCEAITLAMVHPIERVAASNSSTLAIMCGSAVNQDGQSSSLTAPNGPAQTSLVRTALEAASATANSVQFVSLHGTGDHSFVL